MLYFAGDDERLERRHRQGQVLAVINFQRLADNLRLFVKTAKAEVCCEWSDVKPAPLQPSDT